VAAVVGEGGRGVAGVVLAAQRKWIELALPDCLVRGLAPASAATCSGSRARSPMGPTSARI
jgi:hypothetical protein